jgi:uncharacterized protein YfaS (alpha-2-macroglobulin family)
MHEASPWATLYVAELLHACREDGHTVSEVFVNRLAPHLEAQLAESKSASTRAGLVRVLTALGRPQPGWEKRLGEDLEQLDRGGVVELAFAKVLAGRGDEARALLANGSSATAAATESVDHQSLDVVSQRLRSPVRTMALELRARLALDPLDPEVTRLVMALDAGRNVNARGRFDNTLDNAAALVALARYQAVNEGTAADWEGTLTTAAGTHSVNSSDAVSMTVDAAMPVQLATTGVGSAWLSARVVGRRAANAPASDNGLVVRRRWLDGSGAEVDLSEVALGTLVTVEVTLATDGRAAVADVALVDALPGGFEIENPRLANTVVFDEATPRARRLFPERVEFLDDRVLVFATATPEASVLCYHLRAVALGTFECAPIQVEAMYDPEVSSIGGPTTTVVVVR